MFLVICIMITLRDYLYKEASKTVVWNDNLKSYLDNLKEKVTHGK